MLTDIFTWLAENPTDSVLVNTIIWMCFIIAAAVSIIGLLSSNSK